MSWSKLYRGWWWTRKPGVLQSKGVQELSYDWATEQEQICLMCVYMYICVYCITEYRDIWRHTISPYYSQSPYLLIHLITKICCNLKVNTHGSFVVICGHRQSSKKTRKNSSCCAHFPNWDQERARLCFLFQFSYCHTVNKESFCHLTTSVSNFCAFLLHWSHCLKWPQV